MGIRALVVLVGIVMALALGVFSAVWVPTTSAAGWLAVGVLSVVWALSHLTETMIGRRIWDFTAPYPYTSMSPTPDVTVQREAHPAARDRKVWADHMAA